MAGDAGSPVTSSSASRLFPCARARALSERWLRGWRGGGGQLEHEVDTYKADSSAQQKSIAELEQQKRQLAEDLQVSHSAAATYRCRRTQGQGALARAPAKGRLGRSSALPV